MKEMSDLYCLGWTLLHECDHACSGHLFHTDGLCMLAYAWTPLTSCGTTRFVGAISSRPNDREMNPIIRAMPLRMFGFHPEMKDTIGLRMLTSHCGSLILSRNRRMAGRFGSSGCCPEVEGSDPELELHCTGCRGWRTVVPCALLWRGDVLGVLQLATTGLVRWLMLT